MLIVYSLDGLFRIGMKEGFTSLWNGTMASLVLVSNPAIKFTVNSQRFLLSCYIIYDYSMCNIILINLGL